MKRFLNSYAADLCAVDNLVVYSVNSKNNVNNFSVIGNFDRFNAADYKDSKNAAAALLAECLQNAYNITGEDNTLKAIYAAFSKYGVFVPKDIKTQYSGAVRRAVDNSIFICTDIEKGVNDNGETIYRYTLETAFVSCVPLSQTAFGMVKKVRESLAEIKHFKGWRKSAAAVIGLQFNAADIVARIKNAESAAAIIESVNADIESAAEYTAADIESAAAV